MKTPIQKFIDDYLELQCTLKEKGMISELINVNEHYRKILLLSCASYYETRIVETLKRFVSSTSIDDRVAEFVSNKAINRMYHSYFDWDQTNNINKFLGLFGNEFKNRISAEIKNDATLLAQVKAFLIIGSERNKMVHENFLEYKLEKTLEELIDLDEKANSFILYIESLFSTSN